MQEWELIRVFASAEVMKKDVNSNESSLEVGMELNGQQTRAALLPGFHNLTYKMLFRRIRFAKEALAHVTS